LGKNHVPRKKSLILRLGLTIHNCNTSRHALLGPDSNNTGNSIQKTPTLALPNLEEEPISQEKILDFEIRISHPHNCNSPRHTLLGQD
jgi:hypothetical protein